MSGKSDVPKLTVIAGQESPRFKFVHDMDSEISAVGGYAATLTLLAQTADNEPLQTALRRLSSDLYELQEKLTERYDSLFHELHREEFPTA
jgi:hypothetical protein